MPARKVVVEEAPQFTPEQMAAAAASLPNVVINEPSPDERVAEIESEVPAAGRFDDTPVAETMPEVETSFALRRSVEHNGVTYTRADLDRARLTGEAVTRAERVYMIECPRSAPGAIEFSLTYYMILGSIAADIPWAAVKKMDAFDAQRLYRAAMALFFG